MNKWLGSCSNKLQRNVDEKEVFFLSIHYISSSKANVTIEISHNFVAIERVQFKFHQKLLQSIICHRFIQSWTFQSEWWKTPHSNWNPLRCMTFLQSDSIMFYNRGNYFAIHQSIVDWQFGIMALTLSLYNPSQHSEWCSCSLSYHFTLSAIANTLHMLKAECET